MFKNISQTPLVYWRLEQYLMVLTSHVNAFMYIDIFYIGSLLNRKKRPSSNCMFSFSNTQVIWLFCISYFTSCICICYCWIWKYCDNVREYFEKRYQSLKIEIAYSDKSGRMSMDGIPKTKLCRLDFSMNQIWDKRVAVFLSCLFDACWK